ncbi:BgTH12-03089 [Blumeria graminis f. sp. triticale]|uniref:Bgt-424 n=3 Tax=Blumeria graminis TaxID=34373 RepID=A0A9X9QDR3_BLUGR|nr:Constituent of 66S pre-ribosomal particles [Blumeria graminis f. sp. tritici 96224]CAD6503424.1 BgTH12-03089 [Blumeria graminis f. sp. triticale]VDB89513.1 Bgt-424 [Blumeria graminis f. sp. tritici]
MARRRTKKRTHVGSNNGPATKLASSKSSKTPKTMVIRIGAGEVGPSVSQLVKDVRLMMSPDTAARLKERRANRLRDYITMAGPLSVTHLMLFSRSESGNTNLRVAITPRGPTLNFQVEKYSLCKDVRKAYKRPRGRGKEYITAPLLVMNNFTTPSSADTKAENKVPKHLESLVTTIFQSLFPPIMPQITPPSSIKRVMLLNREPAKENDGTYTLNLRHYGITTKALGLSKPLRRLNAAEKLIKSQNNNKTSKGSLPNLGKMTDIAEFMVGDESRGYMTDFTSGSEVDTDAEVEVAEIRAKKILSKQQKDRRARESQNSGMNNRTDRRAVKLVELGPRMRLRMTKVEEGLCSGKIMWHEYIKKTPEEIEALDKRWKQRHQEKEARKRQQRENIEKKKKKTSTPANKEEDEEELDMDEWDSEDFSDEEMLDSNHVEGEDETIKK